MDETGLLAWTPFVDALAVMSPLWEPGRCIYHALTYGHLAGEVLRRVEERSVGRFIAEEIAGPLRADFHVGLPDREDSRAAEMIEGLKASDWIDFVRASPFPHACDNPAPRALAPNDRAWRGAEVPGGNGQSTAHALARVYGMMAAGGVWEGRRLISRTAIEEAARPRFRGMDESFAAPAAFAAGYQIEDPLYSGRASPQTFGHTGWGGAIGFADLGASVGFGYVTNRMLGFDDVDPRRRVLVDAAPYCFDLLACSPRSLPSGAAVCFVGRSPEFCSNNVATDFTSRIDADASLCNEYCERVQHETECKSAA